MARTLKSPGSCATTLRRLNGTAIPDLRMIRHWRLGLPMAVASLTGCSLSGAPTYEFFGAYFPVWLLYGCLAILFALMTRVAMIRCGVADQIAFPLFVCSSIGFILATALWALS
jgi:hypothetical protein